MCELLRVKISVAVFLMAGKEEAGARVTVINNSNPQNFLQPPIFHSFSALSLLSLTPVENKHTGCKKKKNSRGLFFSSLISSSRLFQHFDQYS